MPRNLNRRVEAAFIVDDENIKKEILDILDITLSDTEKIRVMQTDGSYRRADRRGRARLNSQLEFYRRAKEKNKPDSENREDEIFVPITSSSDNI